jgi:putative nucleotidyltransferase with HDIG domain
MMDKINNVFSLYQKYGDKGYIGEDITQLEHAMQAALLAEKENCDSDVVLAAFLHDIGHLLAFENKNLELMGDLGVLKHEDVGADYLQKLGFSNKICELVRNHILTKRYLITIDKNYFNNLSDASKKTFQYQGGMCTIKEILEFEQDEHFLLNIKLREWDDKAKETSSELLNKIRNIDIKNYLSNHYKNTC